MGMRMSIRAAGILFLAALTFSVADISPATHLSAAQQQSADPRQQGQAIFRFDTFGDEQLWTDVLRMQEPLATVDPATALAVGLKVDVDALPPAIIAALRAGKVDLTDPAVTTELLRLNSVVGVKATV